MNTPKTAIDAMAAGAPAARLPAPRSRRINRGSTLVELSLTITLAAALAVIALPRLVDLQERARVTALEGIAGTMRSTILIVRSKARANGLRPVGSNPGGSAQTGFVIDTRFGSSEVDWRNLCPESRAEVGDALTMLDFTTIRADVGDLQTQVGNRSTRVGFDLGAGGCFVEYDSFACTVSITDAGC